MSLGSRNTVIKPEEQFILAVKLLLMLGKYIILINGQKFDFLLQSQLAFNNIYTVCCSTLVQACGKSHGYVTTPLQYICAIFSFSYRFAAACQNIYV